MGSDCAKDFNQKMKTKESAKDENQLQIKHLTDLQFVYLCYYSYLEDYLSMSYIKKNKILLRKCLAKENKWTPFIVYY